MERYSDAGQNTWTACISNKLGKEIMVFVERIENQVQQFIYIPFTAKFGGATGNFNAHHVAFPKIDWIKFGNEFVEDKLGLATHAIHYTNRTLRLSGCTF